MAEPGHGHNPEMGQDKGWVKGCPWVWKEAGQHRVARVMQRKVSWDTWQLEGSSSRRVAVWQLCYSQTSHRDHLPSQNWYGLLRTGYSCLNMSPFLRHDSHPARSQQQDQV